MDRKANAYLKDWYKKNDRKPLVIRGARQVGKTYLVRQFSKECGLQLVELNFEKRVDLKGLFDTNDPNRILLNLESHFNIDIDPSKSVLFLDEIQAVPELLAKLRWFAEEMPELPVLAAGSLLEFVLEDHQFSMPVGRVGYLYLEPFSFEEFIAAKGLDKLLNFIESFHFSDLIPNSIHQQLVDLFQEYILIGGLPAAVSKWLEAESLGQVNEIHHNLISTYRDDFAKYAGRIQTENLEKVLLAVPKMLGEKFVYSQVDPEAKSASIKAALKLLEKSRLLHSIVSTSANGLPLGSEIHSKYQKNIMLDVGIVSALLGLNLYGMPKNLRLELVNKGGVSEQVVGQQLRTIFPLYIDPALYYWQRQAKGSNAELDYIIQAGNRVVPVEVKSGSTGSMKSLHQFMALKKYSLAVRVNMDMPSFVEINVNTTDNKSAEYQLLSIPFYLIGQLPRLVSMN